MTDIQSDKLMTREEAAAALTEAGYKTARSSLSTMACRGGGPPFQKYGPKLCIYTWGTTLAWAKSRMGPIKASTSE